MAFASTTDVSISGTYYLSIDASVGSYLCIHIFAPGPQNALCLGIADSAFMTCIH
jgi:hypothetical protein